MTHLKQLTIVSSLMAMAAAIALSPTPPPDQSYSSINYYGKRPQPIYRPENFMQSNNNEPSATEEILSHSLAASKVIIRPASMLTTTPASLLLGHKQQENSNDGCKCEPIDSCPIELMDFRFAVSCEYGTVRCCRPLEPVLIKETPPNKTVVVTPSSTLKFPKKSTSCRCKPRKECDRQFQSNDGQSIERKMSCPAGSVRCCDSGNMGNHKTESNIEAHVLGGNDFRPVQLPYLKMPQPADERISEQEPLPSDQELHPIENPTSTLPAGNFSAEDPEPTTENGQEEQQGDQQPLEEPQNPLVSQQVVNQPRPIMVPTQQQQNNQAFGFPFRQPVNFQTQINSPIRNPNFNFPMQQNPNFAVGPQFQAPQNSQQPPFQPFRPSPPIRQPGSGPVQQFGPFQPLFPNGPMQPPNVEKPFNLQGPTSFPMFNQQQNLMPPPPQRPMAPSTNPFQQQQFNRPTPTPTQAPAQSSGGFFSSLLNMFGN